MIDFEMKKEVRFIYRPTFYELILNWRVTEVDCIVQEVLYKAWRNFFALCVMYGSCCQYWIMNKELFMTCFLVILLYHFIDGIIFKRYENLKVNLALCDLIFIIFKPFLSSVNVLLQKLQFSYYCYERE